MIGPRTPRLARLASLLLLLTAALLVAGSAFAGSFRISTPEVQEKDAQWFIKLRIDLSKAPSMIHVPMRFTFAKVIVDERTINKKGAEPVHTKIPQPVPAKEIVPMDVDFGDPTGKVFKSTNFGFAVTRENGFFEAGEYMMTMSGPDGEVGSAQRVVLKGDNPPVYRGAMDFTEGATGPAKKKKKDPKIEEIDNGGGTIAKAEDEGSSAGSSQKEVQAVGKAPPMIPEGAADKTAEEEGLREHPKGCGCAVPGSAAPLGGGSSFAVVVALGAMAWRKRKPLAA